MQIQPNKNLTNLPQKENCVSKFQPHIKRIVQLLPYHLYNLISF